MRGDIKIEELPNRFVNPATPIMYCVYDDNLSLREGHINKYTPMIGFNNNNPACDELENGRFTTLVSTVDPNGDRTRPDLVIGLLLKNEFVELKSEQDSTTPTSIRSDNKVNFSGATANFRGSDGIRVSDDSNIFKEYKVFGYATDTLEKFDELGARNIDDLTVVYDVDNRDRLGIQYFNGEVWLNDNYVNNRMIRSYVNHPIDVGHEVGHYIMDKTYKNAKVAKAMIPTCGRGVSHDSNLVTHLNCAWSEGFATFAGLVTRNTPNHTLISTGSTDNFESGTKNGRTFPITNGPATEGWITASLWDIHDSVDERRDRTTYDRVDNQLQNLWNAFSTDGAKSGTTIANNIGDFEDDWRAHKYTDIGPLLRLNHIVTSQVPTTGTPTMFSDTFENLTKWTTSGDEPWDIVPSEEEHVPGHPRTNTVAHADNCDTRCIITMTNSIDLSDNTSAILTFWRFVDRSVDNNEGLKLEISTNNGSSWRQIGLWTENTNDNTDSWVRESISLNRYLQDNVKLRFTAITSSSSEDVQIDDVIIR